MTPAEARRRFAGTRVAHLATASPDGRPHVVPVVFAVVGDRIVSAVDHKPKRTTALRRLANVQVNPAVALLVDHYEGDWSRLWWARADGRGAVLEAGTPRAEAAVDALVARYDQYRGHRPAGPVLGVDVERWSGWAAARS
ncbi:MAG TPA: TIGR03668 family PPOX class F420-dependent oxidoreductase [Acidimicrobiales bacterium]|nr:TIGR03668 family PPOX class F420-dependent oxidoreductase [Acidimicrobiales bacterium]